MTDQEYENQKRECWEEYKRENLDGEVQCQQEVQKTINQCKVTALSIQSAGIKNVLWSLFGSKCLPDEEKPQPKFHKGDRVKVITDCWKDKVYTVTDVKEIYPQFSYSLSCSPTTWFTESTLEPYTEEPQPAEPKEKPSNSTELKSQDADKHFDNILKDCFAKCVFRRLALMNLPNIR